MSREYGLICDECHRVTARMDYLSDDGVQLEQCTQESCGACFKITTTREKLKIKGASERTWEKAVKEALRKKAAVSPSQEPQKKGGEE